MYDDQAAAYHHTGPLPRTLRLRVGIALGSSALLFLLTLPLLVLGLTSDPPATGLVWTSIVVGVVLPAVFGSLMWWQVRRWRRDPLLRRRQLDGSTQRLLLFGNLAVLVLGQVVRGLSGLSFWPGLTLGLVVVLVGAFLVTWIAKRRDPRVRFFGRPDPLPEGQEPDDGPPHPR